MRRKIGAPVQNYPGLKSSGALGRVYTVHPNNAECYYLRLLLHNVKGPTSFEYLRTIQNEECSTFQEACLRLGLLEDEKHWDDTLNEAALVSTPKQLRTLFAIILTSCSPSNPMTLWNNHRESLGEDILIQTRKKHFNHSIEYSDQIFNKSLILIENECIYINNKQLSELGIIKPTHDDEFEVENEKETFNIPELRKFVTENVPKLHKEQQTVYENIMQKIRENSGGIMFLDAPGGTGKTFLLNLIMSTVRLENGITIAVASSGIAATLLEGGRTAHSTFKLPLNFGHTEHPTCNINKKSSIAELLSIVSIILWDECPMTHKKAFEALNETMKDIRGNNELMGGALLLLSGEITKYIYKIEELKSLRLIKFPGDFRQTLPVLPKSTPADEIEACLKTSFLWQHVSTMTLKTNMRVKLSNDPNAKHFQKNLLLLGNGLLTEDNETGEISFPTNFCHMHSNLSNLINNVYPNIKKNYHREEWLSERAILAPRNEDVNNINLQIQTQIPGKVVKYKSVDKIMDNDHQAVQYPVEFLNSLEPAGLPPNVLTLKVGSPIILIRNLKPPQLCNGTRLIIKSLSKNIIQAKISNGKFKGEIVCIPKIRMITTDLMFEFAIRLAYAMSINRSQGQTLQKVGINLDKNCFSHGQLYVACSRVGSPQNLHIYVPNYKTKNIVYKQILN